MTTSEITNPAAHIRVPETHSDGSIAFRNAPSSQHPALRNTPPDRQVTSLTTLASQIAGPAPRR